MSKYTKPVVRRISHDEAKKLYALEEKLGEALSRVARERMRHMGKEAQYYRDAVPQAIYDLLDHYDPACIDVVMEVWQEQQRKEAAIRALPDAPPELAKLLDRALKDRIIEPK